MSSTTACVIPFISTLACMNAFCCAKYAVFSDAALCAQRHVLTIALVSLNRCKKVMVARPFVPSSLRANFSHYTALPLQSFVACVPAPLNTQPGTHVKAPIARAPIAREHAAALGAAARQSSGATWPIY